MKVSDLDGVVTSWRPHSNAAGQKSSYHLEARHLLQKMFPTMSLLEEVTIHPRKGQVAYLDFYVPLIKMAVEVHGEQHYKYSQHFHLTPAGFIASRKRDIDKVEWCKLNEITIIELAYNEEIDVWAARIAG